MRRFLAAITTVITTGLTITGTLAAQAKPDTLVKPAVRYAYPTDARFEKDTVKKPDTITVRLIQYGPPGRLDTTSVRGAIRRDLQRRGYPSTRPRVDGIRLFGDSATALTQLGTRYVFEHYILDRKNGTWVVRRDPQDTAAVKVYRTP